MEARWAGEKVDAALREAFAKSGARDEHNEDFRNLAGALFHVDPKSGRVVTMPDAPNTVPGSEPLAWIHAELKSRRAFWWPGNVSGNARGGGIGANPHGDDSCFRPGPTWNLTAQFAYEGKYGSIAADTARRRYGGHCCQPSFADVQASPVKRVNIETTDASTVDISPKSQRTADLHIQREKWRRSSCAALC